MATDLPEIRQRISVDDSALGGLGRRFGGVASTLGKVVAGGAAIAAAAVGAFVFQGVRGAIDVDRGLREVNTLFGRTGDEAEETFARMRRGVSELSSELGVAQDTLVDGLYSAISAGIPEDNAFEFMRVATKAAIGGVTDVETAVDGLTTIINAWGLEASDAERVADSMFTAVKGGKTTFEELSSSMFQVAPSAAAAGIGFDQINAAIATMTAGGTPTAVATTRIRSAIEELNDPTKRAAQAFEEISGQTFRDFIAGGGDMQGALKILQDEAEATGQQIGDYFGSVEASGAANVLAGEGAAKFAEELEAQAGAAGASGAAFDEMEKSTGRQMEKLKVNLANVGIEIGHRLLPTINRIVEWATRTLPPAMERASELFGRVMQAIGTVRDAVQPFIDILTTLGQYLGSILAGDVDAARAALDLLPGPFRKIAEAIGSVISWVSDLVARFRGGSDEMTARTSELSAFLSSTWEHISGIIGAAVDVIVGIVSLAAELIGGIWERSGEQILGFLSSTWDNIRQVIDGALNVIRGIFEIFAGLLSGDWSRLWDGVKQVFAGVWKVITGLVKQVWATIKAAFSVGRAAIASIWSALWSRIRSLVSGAWSAIKSTISSGISSAVSFLQSLPGRALSAIVKLVGNLRNAARDAMNAFREAAIAGAGRAIDWLRGLPGRLLGALGNVGRILWDAGKRILMGLVDGIKSVASAPVDAVKGVVSKVRNLLPFSPAKEGPLSGRGSPDRAGATLSRMVADGIRSEIRAVDAAAAAMAAAASPRIRGPQVDGLDLGRGLSSSSSAAAAASSIRLLERRLEELSDRPIEIELDLGDGITQRYRLERTREGRSRAVRQGAR